MSLTATSLPYSQSSAPDFVREGSDSVVEPAVGACKVARLSRGAIIALGLVLLVAASVRFSGLDREGLWGDEYIQVVEYRLPPHYTALNALDHHGLGPLDFLIGWVVHRISPTVLAYRIPAATFGVLGVAACFFLIRRLASWQAGLIAAALLCVCRMHLILSQEVRPYSIAVVLLLMTLILLLRAFERPTTGRVLAYGVVLFMVPLTRSLTGFMLEFTVALVLTAALWRTRRDPSAESMRPAIKRLWVATVAAGVATLPMFAYMLYSLRGYTILPSGYKQNLWGTSGVFVEKFALNVGVMGEALYASFGPIVLLLAAIGAVYLLANWRRLTLPVRCTLATMLVIAPVYLLVYSTMVKYQTVLHRYSFFLMPIVAGLAAVAAAAILTQMSTVLRRNLVTRRVAAFVLIVCTLAYPAAMSAEETRSYRRLDWRGSAARLGEFITANDVIMVLSDRPFWRPQITFRGKHDWPRSKKPLAEALWTFAHSDSHFDRLCKQTGRSYTVITYMIEPQREDAYFARGLQASPPGSELTKYRGLDLLVPSSFSGNLFEDMIRQCDELLTLPREHESANAVVLALKARLLLRLHRRDEAGESYRAARALVPPAQLELFDHLTESWGADFVTTP